MINSGIQNLMIESTISIQNSSCHTSETAEGVNMKAGIRGEAMVQSEYPHPANSEGFA